jgi:hypothetical protein
LHNKSDWQPFPKGSREKRKNLENDACFSGLLLVAMNRSFGTQADARFEVMRVNSLRVSSRALFVSNRSWHCARPRALRKNLTEYVSLGFTEVLVGDKTRKQQIRSVGERRKIIRREPVPPKWFRQSNQG